LETELLSSRRKSNALMSAYIAFPDQRFVVEDVLVEGDKAALRVTIHGVPMPPGEPLPIIMEIFRIENGRVAEVLGAGTLRRHES
jgi:predicted ester cyclase